MNYASWIQEEKLKKTFICATLASTLVGTFTASMGLWERVSDRREKHKQKQRDSKQDGEIKQLRQQFDDAQRKGQERQDEIDRLKSGRRPRDEVGDNFERNGAMVQTMYDDMYGRMGSRFARGDAITENQLQAQIIALQQTVISVLQDALYNDRPLTRADMAKLVAASNSAREGSLNALRQQQARLSSHPHSRSPSPPRSFAPPKCASTSLVDAPAPLFCRYSLDLQFMPHKPLAASMAPGGSCMCPACGLRLDVTADDFWMIGKRTPLTVVDHGIPTPVLETREFRLGQRFAVKCHTPDGEYACVLCSENRDVDAICRTVDSLVKHVGTFHEVEELERDEDLREVRVEGALALMPPPASPAGMGRAREREFVEVRGYR